MTQKAGKGTGGFFKSLLPFSFLPPDPVPPTIHGDVKHE